ncbi:hypothetical protein LguiB_019211 [Lonicera macranthoides]
MGKTVKFPGISEQVQGLLDANMDQVAARRRAREAFKDIQLSIDYCLFKGPRDGLKMEEITNKLYLDDNTLHEYLHGDSVWYSHMRLTLEGWKFSRKVGFRRMDFRKQWSVFVMVMETLARFSLKACNVAHCKQYKIAAFNSATNGNDTFFVVKFLGTARKLARSGYGVFAMDIPGFGLSEGLHGYIPSFDKLVDDVIEHYSKVKENPEFHSLPSFLFGESMGGAIALKVHLKQPNAWSGAILVAPMCKIADDMVPAWVVTQVLIGVAKVLPKQKLVPQKDFRELAFRDSRKKDLATYNVVAYKDKPRLRTALELLRTTQEFEHQLVKVSLPLLILHGSSDMVTDPSISKALYEKASSSDKKLNLYEDSYHCLLEGEPDDTILRVFGDMVSWLDKHS